MTLKFLDESWHAQREALPEACWRLLPPFGELAHQSGRHTGLVLAVDARFYSIYVDVMERTTIYLDPQLKRQIKEAARRQRTSEAALIREALNSYLAPKIPKPAIRPVGKSTDGGIGRRVDEALDELEFGRR